MTLRPGQAAQYAKDLRLIYVNAETAILEQIAAAVARGADIESAEARLNIQRRMVSELDKIIRGIERGLPSAIRSLVRMSWNQGQAAAVANLDRAGITAGPEVFGLIRDTASEVALVRAAREPLESLRFGVRRRATDIYTTVGLRTAADVVSGSTDRREASRRHLERLTVKGIKGFTDRSGRSWEMGAYAEMVGRTTAAQASLEGHATRLEAAGVDTVVVSNAPEECETCRVWEGRILSLTGKTAGRLKDGKTVAGTVAEARRAGLFHPNCRHSYSVYLPGVTRRPETDTADPEGDERRQRQRAWERKIRELKRRAVVAEQFGGPHTAVARGRLREAQAEFKSWRDENDRKNLSYRTNTTSR